MNNTYLLKKLDGTSVVTIMFNRADNMFHFVNLTHNYIFIHAFYTEDEAIKSMEELAKGKKIIDFYKIGLSGIKYSFPL